MSPDKISWAGVATDVISSLIIIILAKVASLIRNKYSLYLSNRDPKLTGVMFNIILIFWLIAGVGLISWILFINKEYISLLPAYFIWSIALIWYLQTQRNSLRALGIYGADKRIKKGIDYKKSLELCRNELKFLGVGAAKLTKEDPAFEEAIKRCRQNRPIKLLLCNPSTQTLVDAAKRYGRPETEYKETVVNSLRRIAELKRKYSNIEVKFYEGFQAFRLLFIDDAICLVSYYLIGEGDGSQLPQLHIVRPDRSERVGNSLYYPFDIYFDNLWKTSNEWNFTDYI
jgi:hypothetical protein